MRVALHLLSVILLLPSLVLACAFVIFGHTLAATGFWDFIDRLLTDVTWTVPAVVVGLLLTTLMLSIAGAYERLRWIAGIAVALLAIVSAAVLIGLSGAPRLLDAWTFFMPGFVSLAIGAWLATDKLKAPDFRSAEVSPS
jgi:hypothetical protein